jgi:hypothetical protein
VDRRGIHYREEVLEKVPGVEELLGEGLVVPGLFGDSIVGNGGVR